MLEEHIFCYFSTVTPITDSISFFFFFLDLVSFLPWLLWVFFNIVLDIHIGYSWQPDLLCIFLFIRVDSVLQRNYSFTAHRLRTHVQKI